MSEFTIDKQQMRKHLHALRHRPGEVTQLMIKRWTDAPEEEQRLRRDRSPLLWMGFYQPARYDKLIDDLEHFSRKHQDVVFNVYVGVNPRTLQVLPYADHCLRSGLDILRDRHTPQYPDSTFVIRRNILFDLDYKNARSTDARPEGNPALAVARELREGVLELHQSSLFNTGNNAALVAHLPDGEFSDASIAAFFMEVATRNNLVPPEGQAGVKLDRTWDGYRIMGLSGTPKRKGKEPSRWRTQTIEEVGEESHALADRIGQFAQEIQARAAVQAKDHAALRANLPQDLPAVMQMGFDLDEQVASWCEGYRYLWDQGVEDDRSRALFNLAVKMLWSGWQEHDVHRGLRAWSTRRGYERPDKWYSRVIVSARDAHERGVVPSHKTVEDMLGHCPCQGGCDLEQAAAAHSRRRLLELPWDEAKYGSIDNAASVGLSLKDARDQQAVYLADAIQQCRNVDPSRQPLLFLVTGRPGVGKTHETRRLTRTVPVTWFFDRKSEFKKLGRGVLLPGDLPVRTIHSRADLCISETSKPKLKQLVRRELTSVGRRICDKCEVADRCPYTTQFNDLEGCSVAATSAWVGTPRADDLVQHTELMVFDEDPLETAFKKEIITARDLTPLSQLAESMPEMGNLLCVVSVLEDLLDHLPESDWQRLVNGKDSLRIWLVNQLAFYYRGQALPALGSAQLRAEERVIRRQLDIANLPGAQLVGLASVLHRASLDPDAPCPLYLATGPGQDNRKLVHISGFDTIRLRKSGLVLDATGDLDLYQRLFPDHSVQQNLTLPRLHASVVQICDQRLPMQTLRDEGKWTEVSSIITDLVRTRLREMGGGEILVVARRELITRLDMEPSVVTAYFGGLRGSRDYEDCHTAIIVGTPEPPVQQMAARAEAILNRAVSRDRIGEPRAYNFPVPGKKNLSYGTWVPVYREELLQRLVERVREGELEQAAYRIRPLNPRRANLKIYLLTSIPLRLLPPTQVPITLAELDAMARKR